MKILSLQLGHTATAAIMDNGVILGVLSQEKLDNKKNSSQFPKDAILALLKKINIKEISEIERIIISSTFLYPWNESNLKVKQNKFKSFLVSLENSSLGSFFPYVFSSIRKVKRKLKHNIGHRQLKNNLRGIGADKIPIQMLDHHTCHAYASYFSTVRNVPALIFTCDGEGDDISSSVSLVDKNGNLKLLAQSDYKNSIGWIYSATTRFLGMKILEHEYKVMGLAPYAKEYFLETYVNIFKDVISLDNKNPLRFKSKLNSAHFYNYLIKNASGERFDNIAASVQHLTENLITNWIKNAIVLTGINEIYTGGGVFMNVKLNKKIQEMKEVKKVHFMPSCGDESLPIGALYKFASDNDIPTRPLKNLYLGLSYSDKDIEKYIKSSGFYKKFRIKFFTNIDDKIAELLANKEIVARFSGSCEWGARSLGNRAILAHPSFMESFYTVNDQIKVRDFWMPFAPTILDSFALIYLEKYRPKITSAQHMITSYVATKEGQSALRAAIHQGDKTLRPQVLKEEINPSYYKLIEKFSKITGVGGILNTSFNLHGFPLVCSPEQAFFTLENSELKNLAIGSFLVQKRK
jgi:carbamoyltransferase